MQVFSTWGPLLSTSLAIYEAFRANISVFVSYVMYCDLCFLVFMLNLIFCCKESAVLSQLENSHYVAYLFLLFYTLKSFIIDIISFKEKKHLKWKFRGWFRIYRHVKRLTSSMNEVKWFGKKDVLTQEYFFENQLIPHFRTPGGMGTSFGCGDFWDWLSGQLLGIDPWYAR